MYKFSKSEADFSGWATRNNIRCSDGRTILQDAFKHCDGEYVPLVWNHQHGEVTNVLGHALLENRPEGVYTYGKFNDTESGQHAKVLVQDGNIDALSIFANNLKHNSTRGVLHGTIREVSLVMAGANPGAFIDNVIRHGETYDDEAYIYTDENIVLQHADKDDEKEEESMAHEETVADVFNTLTEKQKNVVYAIIGQALEEKGGAAEEIQHADESEGEETVADVFNTLSEKQKNVVYAIIGEALEGQESEGGNEDMKHNLFDREEMNEEDVISHADMTAAIGDAKRYGSMKDSFLAHGIEDVEFLFPEDHNLNTPPAFIQREMGWVQKVMKGVHHTPFSRIKSMFADIREEDARAKGYIKGKLKKEEVFSLLKRSTTPTTIYKKQKMDRDDVIDITDFDVIAWLKAEMRMMLDEEIARAILIGDGRLSSDDDKINELNIRPISKDEDLYTVKAKVQVAANATADEKAKAFIRTVIKSRKEYKGSGNPTLFTTEDMVSDCLLMEDANGRVIYETVEKLANALRVKEIVTVEVMENAKGVNNLPLLAVLVNLNDYNVGADKGGAVNMFDDFDIDYNAQKYLIETRCSGALIKPFSAIAFELEVAA